MQGLMSERPLLVSEIIKHAAIYHRDTEIVSRTVEGPIHRYTYAEAESRSKRLANALIRLGIRPGDRVGTLAWNTYRHFELYYGISGIGAVCGLAAALGLTPLMRSLLFEVSPAHPLTYAGASAALVLAATIGSYIPAWRATRVDPMEALRAE